MVAAVVFVRMIARTTVLVMLMPGVLTLVSGQMSLLLRTSVVRDQMGRFQHTVHEQNQPRHRDGGVAAEGARTGGSGSHGPG